MAIISKIGGITAYRHVGEEIVDAVYSKRHCDREISGGASCAGERLSGGAQEQENTLPLYPSIHYPIRQSPIPTPATFAESMLDFLDFHIA